MLRSTVHCFPLRALAFWFWRAGLPIHRIVQFLNVRTKHAGCSAARRLCA